MTRRSGFDSRSRCDLVALRAGLGAGLALIDSILARGDLAGTIIWRTRTCAGKKFTNRVASLQNRGNLRFRLNRGVEQSGSSSGS